MDKKFIYIDKEIDEKIEQLKEFQEEVNHFIESLGQMHEGAIDMREALIKIIINKAYKEIADEIGQELSKLFSSEQSMLIRAKIKEILMTKTK